MDFSKQTGMQDTIMIPKLVNKTLIASKEKWELTPARLEDIKTFTLDEVKEYASDILKFDKPNGACHQD
jgi:hypothetical protein